MWQLICKPVRGWEEEDKEVVRKMKWKIINVAVSWIFWLAGLYVLLTVKYRRFLAFRICLFCLINPNICNFMVYWVFYMYLLVHVFFYNNFFIRNCWTLLEIVGLTGQGCIMHILTTLQYFILPLYRDKAQVLDTMTQVFTPLNQSQFWPALKRQVQIYYCIQVFHYTTMSGNLVNANIKRF